MQYLIVYMAQFVMCNGIDDREDGVPKYCWLVLATSNEYENFQSISSKEKTKQKKKQASQRNQ